MDIALRDLERRAARGDPGARAALARARERLGLGIPLLLLLLAGGGAAWTGTSAWTGTMVTAFPLAICPRISKNNSKASRGTVTNTSGPPSGLI